MVRLVNRSTVPHASAQTRLKKRARELFGRSTNQEAAAESEQRHGRTSSKEEYEYELNPYSSSPLAKMGTITIEGSRILTQDDQNYQILNF